MQITPREYQIAELIAWGASDKEVAQELSITPLTAKTHRRNIEHKIEASNTADLTRWFFQEKQHVSFGMSPRTIRHIAKLMFLLVTFSEFSQVPVVRIKTSGKASQQQTATRSRTSRVRRNEYILA